MPQLKILSPATKYLKPATKYLKKLKDKQLKELYHDAITVVVKKPLIGNKKHGDLQEIRGYDFYYKRVKYELAYTLVLAENERAEEAVSIIIITAGSRENFYDDLKRYLKS